MSESESRAEKAKRWIGTLQEVAMSLRYTIATSSRDWSKEPADAWIYGIVVGWDADAIGELMLRHKWPVSAIERMMRLRAGWSVESASELRGRTKHMTMFDDANFMDEAKGKKE